MVQGRNGANVAAVADWIAIRRLTAEYARAVDERDAERLGRLFTEDGVVEVVGERMHRGRAEVAQLALRPRGVALHMTTDPIVDVVGDAATQHCRLLIARATGDAAVPVEFCEAGVYDDDLVRRGDGWRFARRTIRLLRRDPVH